MRKVIVALDSFKGCLSAIDACQAVASGLKDTQAICLPLSDGGEGLTDVLLHATKGSEITLQGHGPLMEDLTTSYALLGDGQTICMEMASTCGLALVPLKQRNPLYTTTFGLGEMIADALHKGYRNFIIGIGGSSTTDAGLGMLQALGYRFYNRQGQLIEEPLCGKHLSEVTSIDSASVIEGLEEAHFTIACDVNNPLYGPLGAAYVFGPQKGADAETVQMLDEGLQHFAAVSNTYLNKNYAQAEGAGAAGGLGFALCAYLHATLKPGIEMVLDILRFDEQLKGADFVITGEGKSDRQTLMGKVPAGVLRRAQKQTVPVYIMAGCIEDHEQLLAAGFQKLININEGKDYPLEVAMKPEVASQNLKEKSQEL